MSASLLAFAILTGVTATAHSASQMIFWRLLTGLGASRVVPLALALMGDLFPYEQRGRPLGWLFGAMAGGGSLWRYGGRDSCVFRRMADVVRGRVSYGHGSLCILAPLPFIVRCPLGWPATIFPRSPEGLPEPAGNAARPSNLRSCVLEWDLPRRRLCVAGHVS